MFAFPYNRPNGFSIKPFCSLQSSSDVGIQQSPTSTASYLITSCGLSSDIALSLSKKLSIKSTERSDAVLQLLRDYGFTNSQISRLVSLWPGVLVACPKKTLMPKFEFLTSIGVALPVLAEKLSSNPSPLRRSLERHTIPYYCFLKSFLVSDDLAVRVILRVPSSFKTASPADAACNLVVLRERGVPEPWIAFFFVRNPFVMNLRSAKFAAYVDRVAEIGISSSKYKFLDALRVFANMSESSLRRKKEIYKRYGWSEADISAVFQRRPLCLGISDKKIMENMNFLVNEVGMEPAAVARCPPIVAMNLEKRLKPRYWVIRILSGKGILEETMGWATLLNISEEKFVSRYVVKYLKDVPRILEFYQGKVSLEEMDLN